MVFCLSVGFAGFGFDCGFVGRAWGWRALALGFFSLSGVYLGFS